MVGGKTGIANAAIILWIEDTISYRSEGLAYAGCSDRAGKRQIEQESRAPTKIHTEDTFSKVGIWPSINKVLF
jgi:hypothetical protein